MCMCVHADVQTGRHAGMQANNRVFGQIGHHRCTQAPRHTDTNVYRQAGKHSIHACKHDTNKEVGIKAYWHAGRKTPAYKLKHKNRDRRIEQVNMLSTKVQLNYQSVSSMSDGGSFTQSSMKNLAVYRGPNQLLSS